MVDPGRWTGDVEETTHFLDLSATPLLFFHLGSGARLVTELPASALGFL